MAINEFGMKLDKNGYLASILQGQHDHCYLCGRTTGKLDRHEIFGGAYRDKSKRLGAWVTLCHDGCHEGPYGVHQDADKARDLKRRAQEAAMRKYEWTEEQFIKEFGKSYTM